MTTKAPRFLALDVFRGLTVCLMIIVNTGGSSKTFSPLLHASWNGFTPTDLVFPSFLFAVGNAMSFVMNKWCDMSQGKVLWKIFKRTAIIFLLGYLMYWFPFVKYNSANELVMAPMADTRVFGVLQRIALCYGIAAVMLYYLKTRTAIIVSIVFLIVYWMLMYMFGDIADPFSLQGNAVLRLDRWLLGDNHLYHGEGVAFDPEGLLSTLPAICNVVAGFVVGKYIQKKGSTYEGLSMLMISGALILFLAYCWNLGFPINKKLWTSSFVLHTIGLDCLILGVIIYITQFLKETRWTYFFEVFGRNPLFIYLLSELGAILLFFFRADPKSTFYQWVYLHGFSWAGDYWSSLLFAVCFMLICWLVGYFLDKRKIYVRV